MSLIRTGLLLDLNSLYFGIEGKFGKKRLLIAEYLKRIESWGLTLTYKLAYSKQRMERSPGFATVLQKYGFRIFDGNFHWHISMALHLAEMIPNIDCFILGSSILDLGELLDWSKNKGIITKCFSVGIPEHFHQFGECIEIDKTLLKAPNEIANTTE